MSTEAEQDEATRRQAAINEALATSDACWRMEQEVLQRKLAGRDAHIKSLEGLLVDAVRERDGAKAEAERMRDEARARRDPIEEVSADIRRRGW